jgi:hypothetical protein
VTKGSNRRDHYLPQGYLRGFIDPARRHLEQPLWHFDIAQGRWSERSTKEVGCRYGLYDYANAAEGAETADAAFSELENSYPPIRERLISSNFENWTDHRDLLLRFFQMMRARSLLFLDRMHQGGRNLRALVVEEISLDRRSPKVQSLTPSPPSDAFVKNRAIVEMRAEIEKGPGWLNNFNWALRRTHSPADPFIVGENPIVAAGTPSTLEDAIGNPDVLLFLPLCWQALLIGSPQFFAVETDEFDPHDMRKIRRMYRESSERFLVSPRRLDGL